MVSLFEYLGHPAGKELGAEVAAYAKVRQTVSSQRHVETPRYTGMVFLYKKEFLDEFFKTKAILEESLKVQSVIGTNRSIN
jgi:hypothetical protein